MTDSDHANAQPTKRLFIEMLTRDILLEDSVLDLIDNSVDSYVRTTDNSPSIADIHPNLGESDVDRTANIRVQYGEDYFEISDDCGGIDIARARNDVFCFGKSTGSPRRGALSVYGIGLKRAVFKLGREITVTSDDGTHAFVVSISIPDWENTNEWWFPLEEKESAKDPSKSGTTIVVRDLYADTAARLTDGTFDKELAKHIGRTYALFLGKYASITVNEASVAPQDIPIGSSEHIKPAYMTKSLDGVTYQIFAGLASRTQGTRWSQETAGWYVACNGRIVVFADKGELTNWGLSLPTFQPKFRGFVGAVFFDADNPENLPWTTTKRGVAKDAGVFRDALGSMKDCAWPVLKFLNSMYDSIEKEDNAEIESNDAERSLTKEIGQVPLASISTKGESVFQATTSTKSLPATIKVQYVAKRTDIERAKKCLGARSWAASEIGRYTLNYFLEQECDE